MSQVVERAGWANGRLDRRQPDAATEVAPTDWAPVRSREDEARAVGVHRQMGGQHVDEERRHANGATRRLRLGLIEEELASALHEGGSHPDNTSKGLEPIHPQRPQLAEAETRVGSR